MATGNRAPSLTLYFNEITQGDILVQDIRVPVEGSAECTFYCCFCWNWDKHGTGYCGIQNHPDGNCFIFSLWDSPNNGKSPVAITTGPGTKVSDFDGEGTGLKTMNFQLGWKPGQWYTLVARRWDSGGNTRFGFWAHDHLGDKWSHLVTTEYPEPGVYFEKCSSFLEDWKGNGHLVRSVEYTHGRKRVRDGVWRPFNTAQFWVNQEPACYHYNNNFNACTKSGRYCLKSGLGVFPDHNLSTYQGLVCDCPPDQCSATPPISFTIEKVSPSGVKWKVAPHATKQFKYTIKTGDKILSSEVDTEKTECPLDLSDIRNVTVELEDILGAKTSREAKLV